MEVDQEGGEGIGCPSVSGYYFPLHCILHAFRFTVTIYEKVEEQGEKQSAVLA